MPPKSKFTMEELSATLDEKLRIFKLDLIKELRNELKEEIKRELATNLKDEIIKEVEVMIKGKDEKIELLESKVAMLQTHVNNLKRSKCDYSKVDDLEQYGRRLCLRIDGIKSSKDETSDQVLQIVKDKIKEANVEIPDLVLDRAHRVGKNYKDRNSQESCQSIIVRFSTFRHRTLLYRARKQFEGKCQIKLDLTKKRYAILYYLNQSYHNYSFP